MQAFRAETGNWEARQWPLIRAAVFVAVLLQVHVSRGQPICGKDVGNRVCPPGDCCSTFGYCGRSWEYCGSGCQNGNCNSSAPYVGGFQCGIKGNKIVHCGDLNYCCSQGGYCGNTREHCGHGCKNGPCLDLGSDSKTTGTDLSTGAYVGIAVGIAVAVVAAVVVVVCVRQGRQRRHKSNLDWQAKLVEDDYRLRIPGKLYNIKQTMRLSFDTLKSATNEFTQVLGRGAFGVVYKGTLQDETKIAVKKLLDNERGLKDFEVEVTTLGNINHANLVALLGFCFEGNQPFVIYEYVSNGSLDRWIFKKDKADFVMPWKIRFNIVRGMAKGLAYLHEDLQIGQAIIHLDIKPENILLDESFIPKVADFGLAKLVASKRNPQSLASGGTVGYMAPEVFTEVATTRMDVYSFGIVLLEVLSGRRHLDRSLPRDSAYMPAWAIRKVIRGEHLDVIDPLLGDEDFDAEEATRLILVALLCLQRDPDNRPEMSSVLKMMVGLTIPVELPPTLKSELEMAERVVLGALEMVAIDILSTKESFPVVGSGKEFSDIFDSNHRTGERTGENELEFRTIQCQNVHVTETY